MVEEDGVVLCWCDQEVRDDVGVVRELIDLELLPTATNVERGVPNLEFVLQLLHAAPMGLTSYEANESCCQLAEEIRWKLGEDCRKDTTRKQEQESETCFARSISPGRCSLLELHAGIERWESYVSRYERKLKDTVDDEIKLAGLEAVVLEELEKHVILNSNRL